MNRILLFTDSVSIPACKIVIDMQGVKEHQHMEKCYWLFLPSKAHDNLFSSMRDVIATLCVEHADYLLAQKLQAEENRNLRAEQQQQIKDDFQTAVSVCGQVNSWSVQT